MCCMPICGWIVSGPAMSAEADVKYLLLRGVNVGAHRKLPMADLRAILAELGARDVQTHIQSGNAVFRGALDGTSLAQAIGARFGFAPAVMILTRPQYAGVLAANPFAASGAADGAPVHIGFLAHPSRVDPATLQALAIPGEFCHLTPEAFYLHAPAGVGRSVLAARAERVLGVPMTMRNQRVAVALAMLAQTLQNGDLPC